MKLYIVFKVRDMTKRNKEFIIDSVYVNELHAIKREIRLHQNEAESLITRRILDGYRGLFKTKHQQTYIIRKSTKGKITLKVKEVTFNNVGNPRLICEEVKCS